MVFEISTTQMETGYKSKSVSQKVYQKSSELELQNFFTEKFTEESSIIRLFLTMKNKNFFCLFFLFSVLILSCNASKKFEKGLLYGVLLAQAHKHHHEIIPVHEPIHEPMHHPHHLHCHDDHKW
jgi:hypothetical protein